MWLDTTSLLYISMLAEFLVVLWNTPTWDGNDWEMPQKKSKGCCRYRGELEIGRWTASAAPTASRNATGVINDRSDLCCDSIWKASCHFPAMRQLRSRMPKLIWLGRKFCSNCLGQVYGCCVFWGIKHITKVCKLAFAEKLSNGPEPQMHGVLGWMNGILSLQTLFPWKFAG